MRACALRHTLLRQAIWGVLSGSRQSVRGVLAGREQLCFCSARAQCLCTRPAAATAAIFFKFKFYFWMCWVFVAARGLSLVAESGGYSSLRCAGFSLRWLLLWSTGSRCEGFSSCGSWALERSLSGSGTRAELLRGMWDISRTGLGLMSPALAGGFLTSASFLTTDAPPS